MTGFKYRVATLALTAALVPALTGATTADGSARGHVDITVRLTAQPDVTTSATSERRIPRSLKEWSSFDVKVNGLRADVVFHRNCEADLVRLRVLVTVNTCGRRVIVRAASTGHTAKRVTIRLQGYLKSFGS